MWHKTVSAALSVIVKPPGWEKLKSGRLLPPIEAFVDFRVVQNAGRRGFRTEDSYKQPLSFLRPSKGREGVAPWGGRLQGLFVLQKSPQHSFLLPFLSSICVCGTVWNSSSSNGYFQTPDLPGFPHLVLGTPGYKDLPLQGRTCTVWGV